MAITTQSMPMATTTMATTDMLMATQLTVMELLHTVMELELPTLWESVKPRHLFSPMLLLSMPTAHTPMPMLQLLQATSRFPPQLLPMASTSSTSERLSPKVLLFTPVLLPHPPSEAHKEPLLSMDTLPSMDMVMDTPPTATIWESVRLRLSPKVLLFTQVMLPHLSTEAPRVPQLSILMLLTTELTEVMDTSK